MFLDLLLVHILFFYYSTGQERCFARDCQDYKDRGFEQSGVYHVTPVGTFYGFDVYCDMETDDGGWLVFQRRENGSLDFYKGWQEYELGFGDITREHWLGNFLIHMITQQGFYELRIELEDWENNTAFANYKVFHVGHAKDKYQLKVSGYSGTAGDSLHLQNRMAFTTKDKDNDNFSANCANRYSGAWWFKSCHGSNLNGNYLRGSHNDDGHGVIWYTWTGQKYSLKRAKMKMRRI